ncbi:lysophospholipid acyltransferase family protein [Rothia sp. P6271]|uniref:lysophospholipid acyltransferase family protein n=1 Tax=Rothia sp. P6271 TaxID=3402659 RepID=UPI003AC994EE
MKNTQSTGLYMVLKKVCTPLLGRIYKHRVQGQENLPTGGAILASNHLAFCDSLFIPMSVPRQVFFLAKSDYFTGTGLKGRIMRWFFSGVGQIPMDRSGGAKSQASLNQGIKKLHEGCYLGIYPEGTRSPDGRAYRAKIGVAKLALSARVPVVPIGQIGTDRVQPLGTNAVRLKNDDGSAITVETRIGKPLDFSEYWDRASEHKIQRLVADRIVEAIRELSEQEYVPVYAADVKERMKKHHVTAQEAISEIMS